MSVNIKSKYFNDLSSREVYEILKARAAVFIVEQNIVYQDMDDIDYRSLHVFTEEDGKVTSYLRAYAKDPDNPDVIKMGRVLTIEHGKGLGKILLKAGIDEIKAKFNPKTIYIEAQKYAIGFYEKEGFKVISDEFLEEGIMHVQMILTL